MSHSTENGGVFHTFQEKMCQLRKVKGVTKKKLKAQEYNLKRKLGICFSCASTNHTHAKCPEEALKHDEKTDICVPHAVETCHESKELPPQQLMETVTKNYHEECSNMLTDTEVDKVETCHENKELPPQEFMEIVTKNYHEECSNMLTDTEVAKVDNLLLDNLLETLGPSPKKGSIPDQTSLNTQQDINHIIMGEEIGNFCQFQENIQYETTNSDEILNHTIPIKEMGMELQDKKKSDKYCFDASEVGTGEDSQNMAINKDKCLYVSYSIIDEDNIPLVISRGKDLEKSENLLAKKKKSTRKVGRPKKSAIGNRPTNDALEIDTEGDSNKMSVNIEKCLRISYNMIDEDNIPLVIPRGNVPEISLNQLPKKKKSIQKVGR